MFSLLRTSARRLWATPAFSAVVVVSIAFAIAANAAIFCFVDALVLRPVPFKDPDGLLQIWSGDPGSGGIPYVRPEAALQWRELRQAPWTVEVFQFHVATLLDAGEPETVPTSLISAGLMEMLGVRPLFGRSILPADARPGATRVAVIGENLWRTRFGGDPQAVGRRFRLDDTQYQIIGVMPRAFRFPRASHQVWTPLVPGGGAGQRPVQALLRLKPGVTPEAARAQLETVAKSIDGAERSPYGWRVTLRRFGESSLKPSARTGLLVLLGAAGLVLVISCSNVAALMLVRGSHRRRELAIQAALGATRRQLLSPLVAEAALLTIAAAVAGGFLSTWLTELLLRFTPPELVRLSPNEVSPGWRVYGFTAMAALVTSVVVGLAPGLRASRANALEMLRGMATSSQGPLQQRFRRIVVVGQIALSVMLLVGAALLARTFIGLTRVDPGFQADRVLAIDFIIQQWKYRTPAAQQQYFEALLDRLRGVAGVRRVELSGGVPPGGGLRRDLHIATDDGRLWHDQTRLLPLVDVGPEYFATLGLPLRDGRAFSKDDVATQADVVVISESVARRLWADRPAVGRRIRIEEGRWYSIVGVAGDVFRDYSRDGFAAYLPLAARGPLMRTIVVQTHGDPAQLAGAVRSAIATVDPEQPIAALATASDLYGSFLGAPRFYAWLMGLIATFAALLAAAGLYGVLAYSTAQRVREFGIRLALGATAGHLHAMVLVEGLLLAGAGLLAGILASSFATRTLESLLVGVRRADSSSHWAVMCLVTLAAAIACWLPARRASATDPAVTLRLQ